MEETDGNNNLIKEDTTPAEDLLIVCPNMDRFLKKLNDFLNSKNLKLIYGRKI